MSELDDFKTNINLSEFAASCGYSLDSAKSWKGGAVMKHPDGHKIVVGKKGTHWTYYTLGDEKNKGSIIDFIQRREGSTLGNVRKRLREWSGQPRPQIPAGLFSKKMEPSRVDREQVARDWEKAHFCNAIQCLTLRGITREYLGLHRFKDTFKIDHRNNALFPHYDKRGLCGFEVKNTGFTGFSKGGVKGLWFSRCLVGDTVLVISETAIDSLSHAILNPNPKARYFSTGGALNLEQPALIRAAMERMPEGSIILLAFDADKAGDKLADDIAGLAPSSVKVQRDRPPAKDWNQVLKNKLGLE